LDNRLSSWTGPGGVEQYGYLADNKRVWKKAPSGAETVYFYGAGGQKLITYTVQASPFALISPSENVYFGGKLIRANGISVVHDRLGSVVARGCADCGTVTKHDYLPYGEEMGSTTAGNVDKFGTYHRDATSGLDYADQRYFAGLSGRFLSSDPYEASGGAAEPGSWNRYPYVGVDPVNAYDPEGLKCIQVTVGNSSNWADDGKGGGCVKAGVNGNGSMNSHTVNVSGNMNTAMVLQYTMWAFPSGRQFLANSASLEVPPDFAIPMPFAQPFCGVNPITGQPGLDSRPSGQPGALRPGVRGGGGYNARRDRNGDGIADAIPHRGMDFAGVPGQTSVSSPFTGTVRSVSSGGDFGLTVIVNMGTYDVLLAHLSSASVVAGQQVFAGQQIGILGQSGNANGQLASEAHVHMEIRDNGAGRGGSSRVDPSLLMNGLCPW